MTFSAMLRHALRRSLRIVHVRQLRVMLDSLTRGVAGGARKTR